ncbi:protein JASON isoform X3 [Lolium perenne]|uniref:protein JASON isoform X3 n=1 Tax=Lolium perenne TaxID=4522 RepID=UPI0021F5979D|nr:protein JASON-like isoform X3 [Lolium perenne]
MCGCAAAIARAVVDFLDAVLVACFRSWFRPGPVAAHRDPPVHRDRLSDEEKGFGTSKGSDEHLGDDRGIDKQLRQEADYLKLCGTISQTPAELQNASSDINLETANEVGKISGIGATSVSEFNSSECFKCEEDHTLMTEIEVSRVESVDSVPQSVLREKSPFWSIKNRFSGSNGSPCPTPLVLSDDMQTPGTIYTSHTGSSMSRKRVRTRKQFVYPVLRPIENRLHLMEPTEDSLPMLPSNTPTQVNLRADYIKKPHKTSSNSVAKVGFSKSPPICFPNENALCQEKETHSPEELKCQISSPKSNSDEKHAALSLAHWLKPPSPEDVENPTPELCKAWDGNCIPNTTTKYKEDQKVSWHATPFEERLLKVLSDEPNPPRKLVSGNSFQVEDGNGIPNTTTKYKEDQKVSWHATPFEERLLRFSSDELNPPRKLIRGNMFHVEETC